MKIVATLLILLALFWYRLWVTEYETHIGAWYDKKVIIVGHVITEPQVRESNIKITLRIESVMHDSEIIYPQENVIVNVSKFFDSQIGDKVRATGILEKPENFNNDNGLEFDYVNFLAKDRIFSLMYFANVEVIGRDTHFVMSRALFDIKNAFLKKISTVLPSPQSELLGGLLLGVKQSLGKSLETDFRRVGLIHVVVLSGYNITIIIVAVFAMLSRLPRFIKYGAGVLFIILFALMVGLGSTVVRASIMSVIAISAKVLGRDYNVNRALFLAGYVMVLWNPMILFHDPSFQLSFLATLGLINLSGRISEWLSWLPERAGFREIVSSTISTQIAVLPLILKMTGEISVIALPVNLIVLPLIPATMLVGFITGVAAYVWWPIGFVIGFMANLLLSFELWMVETFSSLSFAVAQVPAPSAFVTVLFYGLVIIIFYYRPIEILKKVCDVVSLAARKIIRHK